MASAVFFNWPLQQRRATLLALVIVAAAMLQACGGAASDNTATAMSRLPANTLLAVVEACAAPEVNDSSHVIYVTLPPSCAADLPERSLAIGLSTADGLLDDRRATQLLRVVGEADTGAVSIDGLGERQVQLVMRNSWRKLPHSGQWAPRDGAGLLQLGDALYLLGGWLHGPVTNEVWRTVDLMNWEFLGYAPWQARHGAAWRRCPRFC